ncbi:hypothetical protein NKH70_06845 [Mesorhizobium sp. M0991]|uniref:hypothetical protein n=2 Tax=unclassified Mesorhizobium TaxID=325217 RepID=UPI00333D8BFA
MYNSLRVEFQPRHRIALPRTAEIETHKQPNHLGGGVTFSAIAKEEAFENWEEGFYRTEPRAVEEAKVTAVSYFAWDNRDPGESWSGSVTPDRRYRQFEPRARLEFAGGRVIVAPAI